jgi:Protein of unknown function (DUF992)
MYNLRLLAGLAVLVASSISVSAQIASPKPPVVVITPPGPSTKIGMLTCNMSPGIGFVVGGQKSLACTFMPDGPYPAENYLGDITTIGLDVGVTGGGVMAWAVFMPTRGTQYGALAGSYGGVSGDLSLGYTSWRVRTLGYATAVFS